MTKRLEDMFNLSPSVTETEEDVIISDTIADNKKIIQKIDANIDKIDMALPMVSDLSASDTEMDELAALATDSFTTLMDLSMSVDPRFSGVILQSASTLLGHAITAKTAKMDAKLKIIDLQLKKMRLDQQAAKDNKAKDETDNSDNDGKLLDRNELLRMLLNKD